MQTIKKERVRNWSRVRDFATRDFTLLFFLFPRDMPYVKLLPQDETSERVHRQTDGLTDGETNGWGQWHEPDLSEETDGGWVRGSDGEERKRKKEKEPVFLAKERRPPRLKVRIVRCTRGIRERDFLSRNPSLPLPPSDLSDFPRPECARAVMHLQPDVIISR